MLSIKIICVGKLKEQFYFDASKEFEKRLTAYCKLEIMEIPEYRLPAGSGKFTIHNSQFTIEDGIACKQNAHVRIALDKERIAIEKAVPAGTLTVALCIEGRQMSSDEFSAFLSECAVHGASRLCFIIGGSNGLHNKIKMAADMHMSMSKMTFPHNLARIVLLEQLYRAFNITEGGKYHK